MRSTLTNKKVMFLGYSRPPTRGAPALTVGRVYDVYDRVRRAYEFSALTHFWVRNDRGRVMPYASHQFEEVKTIEQNHTGVSP